MSRILKPLALLGLLALALVAMAAYSPRPFTIPEGGTGAATAAGARSNLGALAAAVTSASAPTANDDSGDGYAVGQIWIETTSDIAYVLADATPTAAVWRALLGPQRLREYVSGGTVYAVLEGYSSSTWATLKGPVTVAKVAGTSALGVTASGSGLSFPAGYATAADQPSEGDSWPVDLSALGVTWTPGANSQVVWTYDTSTTEPGTNYVQAQGFVGDTSDWTPGFRIGYGRHVTTLVVHANGDNLATTTGTTCTRGAAASAVMGWANSSAQWASARGRTSTAMVTPTSTQPSGALGGLSLALVALRPATGGGAATLNNVEVVVYPAAGELSW